MPNHLRHIKKKVFAECRVVASSKQNKVNLHKKLLICETVKMGMPPLEPAGAVVAIKALSCKLRPSCLLGISLIGMSPRA